MLKFALPFIAFALFDIVAFGSVPAVAADRLAGVQIAKHVRGWEKPSDHVPVMVELRAA